MVSTLPAGQPDWQLYQSAVGPFLYNETSAAPLGLQNRYMGSWRSIFVNASDSGNGDVWDMLLTFANDAARTQIVRQIPIILGTGFAFAGFIPVLAPYLTIGVSNTVPAAGQNFSGSVLPLLADPPTMGRFLPNALISNLNQTLSHNNFTNSGAVYITSGPVRLTYRATSYLVRFDVQTMASNGVWGTIASFYPRDRLVGDQVQLTLPYQPVRVQVTNQEAFTQVQFDVRLEPI